MELNGIQCEKYSQQGNRFEVTLVNTNVSKISELDGQVLCITKTETEKVYFGGYTIVGIELYEEHRYLVRFLKSVSDLTEKAIEAANGNIEFLQEKIQIIESNVQSTSNEVTSVSLMAPYIMPMISSSINDSTIVTFKQFAQEWSVNHDYKKGEFLTYNNKYFRVSQDHKSQEQWTPGSVGTESLYYEVVIADDGIIVWSQPSGSYNAPNKGDLRHYPDADSSIYKSLIDGNSYSPTDYPAGWELVE